MLTMKLPEQFPDFCVTAAYVSLHLLSGDESKFEIRRQYIILSFEKILMTCVTI